MSGESNGSIRRRVEKLEKERQAQRVAEKAGPPINTTGPWTQPELNAMYRLLCHWPSLSRRTQDDLTAAGEAMRTEYGLEDDED